MHREQTNGLWGFFGLTAALTALTFGLMAVLGMTGPSLGAAADARPIGYVLFALGGFSPSIAAFVVALVVAGRDGTRDLWRRGVRFALGWKWYGISIAIFIVGPGAQILAVALSGGALVRPDYFSNPGFVLANLPALLLLGPVSEEFGWRGFALDRMLARWSRPVTNLILGLLWSLWHLPLFFIEGTSQSSWGAPLPTFAVFTLQVTALTVVYTWIYRHTNRSIWSAIFLHFLTAFAWFIGGGFIEGGGSFLHPATVGVYVVIAVAITLFEDLRPAPAAGEAA